MGVKCHLLETQSAYPKALTTLNKGIDMTKDTIVTINGTPYVIRDEFLFSPEGIQYQLIKTDHLDELEGILMDMLEISI